MAFDQARKLFVREANQFWPPLVDIYKALVLMQLHADRRARALCESALKYFRSSPAVSKRRSVKLCWRGWTCTVVRPRAHTNIAGRLSSG